jgi:hypothetical protein
VVGAVGGATITAACTALIFWIRHRTALRNEHLSRAFDRHLERYEKVFTSARTAQESLSNYGRISNSVTDRTDPFLYQLLTIATASVQDYCVSVTWTHNPGMLYLDIELEQKCLEVRNQMQRWLAIRRVYWGDVAAIRTGDMYESIELEQVRSLSVGSYRELRLETRRLVKEEDPGRLGEIDRGLSVVIAELKAVMSY